MSFETTHLQHLKKPWFGSVEEFSARFFKKASITLSILFCPINSKKMDCFVADEETAFEHISSRKIDPSVMKLLRTAWKENFASVGEQLLGRIESVQPDLVPLETPNWGLL